MDLEDMSEPIAELSCGFEGSDPIWVSADLAGRLRIDQNLESL